MPCKVITTNRNLKNDNLNVTVKSRQTSGGQEYRKDTRCILYLYIYLQTNYYSNSFTNLYVLTTKRIVEKHY